MAISGSGSGGAPAGDSGKKARVGANVALATALVVAIVAVLQAVAFTAPPMRADMTQSRANSLGEGTKSLLRALDGDITLTSLYFETDLEDEDQKLYRQTVDDLLGLYQSMNRPRVRVDWINPLSDHDKMKALAARLRDKEKFKKELAPYDERIAHYRDSLDATMRGLVQKELEALRAFGGPMGNPEAQAIAGQVEQVFNRWASELDTSRNQVDGLSRPDNPQPAAAVTVLRSLYRDYSKTLKDVAAFGKNQAQRAGSASAELAAYLNEAGSRYGPVVAEIEGETTKLQELQPPKVAELLDKLAPNANPIVVETAEDAIVVEFTDVWSPVDENRPQSRFRERAFKGEEKVTSAILRATNKEQTAVVFVRYGGMPLFMGAFAPGQPGGPYAEMRGRLEDASFTVHEWDLKASTTQPKIEPAPTKTVYVVLKPQKQERNPMQQQQAPEPPFAEQHRKALMDAMGDKGRALFVAGWNPGPFGPIPDTYEFADYLKDTWGVEVESGTLLLELMSIGPGKYAPGRRDVFSMNDFDFGEHSIIASATARVLTLPWCAPLKKASPSPEGVTVETLITMPKRDGVWGVHDVMKYNEQGREQQYLSRVEGDTEGPFDLAVAASKGDAKVVVVSSRGFAEDAVATGAELVMAGQGLALRARNPGNSALLINALQWLSDNTQYMNIGQPMNTATVEVKSETTLTALRGLTIFVWPAMALAAGGVMWSIRRR